MSSGPASLKQQLKRMLLPEAQGVRRIPMGLARRLSMRLNLHNQLQRYLGLYEREIASHVRCGLASARSAIDVGANDGYYTLVFLAAPLERVIACEPGEVALSLLENAALNGHSTGALLQVERRLVGRGEGGVRLGELIDSLPRPVFIKMDIDGGEADALASAEGAAGLAETSWVVETHSIALERDCEDWFVRHGFKTKIVDHAWWRMVIPELRPTEQNRWLVAKPQTVVAPT